MSNPIISQYFASNPPSFFDEIDKTEESTNASIAHLNNASEIKNIPDEVKDFWQLPSTEPGIPPMLTMPGVQSPNDLPDPIKAAVLNLLGESEANNRKILTADDVTQDERGLRQLIKNGCFRSAVNLTGRLLTIYGQGYGRTGQPAKHTPHSLQLWFTRFALLIKLGLYKLCESEAEPFDVLNKPDVYYSFYPEMYNNRKGSMASFSFRLLLAELPSYAGQPKITMDRLTDLVSTCSEIKQFYQNDEKIEAFEFWERREIRVIHSLINCALLLKDFGLADNLMEKLAINPNFQNEQKRALYSAWGRMYLQCGDVFGAERKFSEARRIRDTDPKSDLRDLIDKGLIAVAQNDFQTAFGFFENAIKMNPSNTMLLNNMGVCCLYSGKLQDAIKYFESAVKKYPDRGLNESSLLNLSTLYELESMNHVNKKLELLKNINRHPTDLNINLDSCLKLQTNSNKMY